MIINENGIAKEIIDAALKVHKALGPGLLESIYEAALFYELRKRELEVTRQQAIKVIYDGQDLGLGFRADLIVENCVIIELKSVSMLVDVHKKQLLSYLKLTDKWLGLLINFNVNLLKDGIVRIVNGYR